jgi:hypothetical protein
MDDSKKNALLQAANKLKNAKKNVTSQNDGTKSGKSGKTAGGALKNKIRDVVSKFADE